MSSAATATIPPVVAPPSSAPTRNHSTAGRPRPRSLTIQVELNVHGEPRTARLATKPTSVQVTGAMPAPAPPRRSTAASGMTEALCRAVIHNLRGHTVFDQPVQDSEVHDLRCPSEQRHVPVQLELPAQFHFQAFRPEGARLPLARRPRQLEGRRLHLMEVLPEVFVSCRCQPLLAQWPLATLEPQLQQPVLPVRDWPVLVGP